MKNKTNNSLSTLVNNSIENFNNIWKPIEDSFKEFDKVFDAFDKVKDSFLANSNNFVNDFKDILKDVKDTKKAFEYVVDFDEDKEKIEYKIEDGCFGKNLVITIESNGGLCTTVKYVSIPNDCDSKKIFVKYNDEEKKEVFMIPKRRHHSSDKKKQNKDDKNKGK